jgi:Tfp pilus assembly protein PilF
MAKPGCLSVTLSAKLQAIVLLSSLALGLSSCQTTQADEVRAKKDNVIASQKAIVHNALDNGDTKLAYATLRSLINAYPEDATLQNLMGLTQLAMKNSTRAVRHFQAAYKLDKSPGIALNLSSAYIETGDYDKSVKLISSILREPGTTKYQFKERLLHNLGFANVKLKKNTRAESFFKQALEENPSFYPSHLELARLQKNMGRPALAMRSYRNAMDYCHVCLDPVSELTTLYVKSGKMRDARDILLRYGKVQGVAESDKKKAANLLQIVTASDLIKTRTF